jgi:hypothetical protein
VANRLNINEKNYIGNTQRDQIDLNSNKEVLHYYGRNGDPYNKNYKEILNIIPDRYEIDRNSNKDERRKNNDFSDSKNSNKDSIKYEISNTNNKNNNNAGYGTSSSNSIKLDKNLKALDKIKFSNINNLEFFNQKYHK